MTACDPQGKIIAVRKQDAGFRGCDIIFVSLENWDEVWRRNQFICASLAGRFPESKILFVGPPRDVSNSVRRGRLSHLATAGTWTTAEHPNITVTRPLKWLPNSIALGRRLNESLALRRTKRVARQLGMDKPLLWLNPHFAVSMAGRLNESAIIYDITDDWTELDVSGAEAQLIASQDADLCRLADAVIVCSERLHEKKRSLAKQLHLIPNGVHAVHYESVLDRGRALPAEAARWKRPVLGYTGTVHSSRVDVGLIEALARSCSHGSVVLIGPDFLSPADAARLDNVGNVHRLPPVPYSRIPDYMRAFDVCIVPHRMTAFTESLNPIKLWEYLAAGKPIVSTAVPGFRDYPELVHVAQNAGDFIARIDAALREGRDKVEARQREARRHSWDSRVDDVVRVIESCVSKT